MKFGSIKLWALAFALGGVLCANDLDDRYAALKDAQTKKDPDAVKKLAVECSKLARVEATAPQPADAAAVADWKQRVEFAKQVDLFAEYSLATTAIATAAEPDKMEELVDALLVLNPKSQYLTLCSSTYLAGLAKTPEKQLAAAQKLLTANGNNEEALEVLALGYSSSNPERASGYATRLITVMKGEKKPDGVTDADWEKQKSAKLGNGYYIAGTAACTKSGWIDCDRNLKLAVPYVSKDQRTLGITYFYLGLADYQIGKVTSDRTKIQEGQKYSEQSAAIPGPMQAQAYKNATAMKAELAAPRR
ncbi:MAG TPA: hypothetical protein VGG72_05380 [Bryobacteraceae bacterium]|jgi:hypothetical protein